MPSLLPLSNLQACDGTVSQLRQFLVELNRSDAVNIIDRAMESKKEEENSASKGEGSSSSHDSGEMGECWYSSYSHCHSGYTVKTPLSKHSRCGRCLLCRFVYLVQNYGDT